MKYLVCTITNALVPEIPREECNSFLPQGKAFFLVPIHVLPPMQSLVHLIL